MALLGLTAALVAASFPAGLYAVFSGSLSSKLGPWSLVTTYFFVGPVAVVFPVQVYVGGTFALVLAIYAGMLGFSLLQQKNPARALRSASGGGMGKVLESPFIVILVAIGFLNFSGLAVTSVSQLVWGSVGNPFSGYDPLLEFGSLALAPLREEIGFRVLIIGLVALVLSAGRPPRTVLKTLWRPSVALEGVAVGSATSILIWGATAGSAVVFGICHVNCGGTGGWSWSKFPDALWGGVVLGYLYVRYGLHAAVLTHWGVDYLGAVFAYFGQAAYGVPANSLTVEYWLQSVLDVDMVLLFGLFSFGLVVAAALRKTLARRGEKGARLVDKALPGWPPPAT